MKKFLPSTIENIYPKSHENLKAVWDYYFFKMNIKISDAEIIRLQNFDELSLNQIEFIFGALSDYYEPLFKVFLEKSGNDASNLISYGIDAFMVEETLWKGSINRNMKTKELKEQISSRYNK